MDRDRARSLRARVSAALLAAGTLAFVGSLALPGVTKVGLLGPSDDRKAVVDGWTCAWNHGPTAATNWFLAFAFAVWGFARWGRSVWAWYLGAGAGIVAVLVHGFVGAWPGYEGILRLHSGYWTWLVASAVTCAAFLLLPRPVRPPPGEPLPVEDRDRVRAGISVILGSAATAALLTAYFLVPDVVSSELVPGEEPEESEREWYTVGPVSSGNVTHSVQVTLADGTVEAVVHHYRHRWGPVVATQLRAPETTALTWASLALPAVFLAAATTRRRPWRFGGAALAAAVTLVVSVWIEHPWPTSGINPHPLHFLWIATPAAFVLAFLLLPPRRVSSSRATESAQSDEPATPPQQASLATE